MRCGFRPQPWGPDTHPCARGWLWELGHESSNVGRLPRGHHACDEHRVPRDGWWPLRTEGHVGSPARTPEGRIQARSPAGWGGGGIEAGAAAWPCLQVGPSACRRRCLGAPFRCWGLSTRNRFVARAAPCPTLGGAGAWSCTSASTGSFQLSPSSTPRKGRRAAVPASTGGGEKRSHGRARGAEPLSRSARRAGGHLHFQVRGFSESLGTFCLPASR